MNIQYLKKVAQKRKNIYSLRTTIFTMESISLIKSILTLLLIIGIGYSCRRYNILTKDAIGGMSKFVLFVALPSLILISSTSQKFNYDQLNIIFLLLIATSLYYAISIIISFIVPRLIHSKQNEIGVYRFILVFPSAVFFAFPLIEMILGKSHIFYAAIFNLPYFLLTFSLGIWLMTSSSKSDKVSIKFNPRFLLNFAFLATLIGLFLYFTSIPIREPIYGTLNLLGNMATPLALIVTGGFLFEVEIFSLFKNIHHYLIAISRLIVLPLIVYAVLIFVLTFVLPSDISDREIVLAIAVIIASMPAAVQTIIVAAEYKANPEIAAEVILITTILAAFTLPLILFITQVV